MGETSADVERDSGLASPAAAAEAEAGRSWSVKKHMTKGIAKHYVTRLFIIDVLAVAPCLYALCVAGTPHELAPFLQAGGSRLIKLCRLLDPHFRGKTLQKFTHAALAAAEDRWGWDDWDYFHSDAYHAIDNVLSVVQKMFVFFGVVHVTGTIWYDVGFADSEIPGWVSKQVIKNAIID